jgi:hypothetical protein
MSVYGGFSFLEYISIHLKFNELQARATYSRGPVMIVNNFSLIQFQLKFHFRHPAKCGSTIMISKCV